MPKVLAYKYFKPKSKEEINKELNSMSDEALYNEWQKIGLDDISEMICYNKLIKRNSFYYLQEIRSSWWYESRILNIGIFDSKQFGPDDFGL